MLFLGGHRKCGTTLLLNLFDNHPQLCVYPHDVCTLYAYYPKFNQNGLSRQQQRDRLNKVIFDFSKCYFAERGWSGRLDFDEMKTVFWKKLDRTDLSDIGKILEAQVESFKVAAKIESADQKADVIKETSIEIYATLLLSYFKNSKFIHLLRDPRDNFAALKAGLNKRYKDFYDDENSILSSLIHRYGLGMKLAELNKKRFGKNRYKIVCYEALTKNTESTVKDICEFLNIAFHPVLLKPTVLGLPTRGNNFDNIDMTSVSTVNVGRWKNRITEKEAKIIEFHFRDLMLKYGYDCEYDIEQQIDAATDFYKWTNYQYYYFDHFQNINSI